MPDKPINNLEQTEPRQQNKRDVLFIVMLILSMVNAASSVVTNLIVGILQPSLQEMFDSGTLPIPETMINAMQMLLQMPRYYFFIVVLFWALSFYGALSMWKYSRVGFHCYTLAQLILLLLPVLFAGRSYLALGDIMFTLLFVVYYAGKVMFRRQERQDGF